MRHARTVLIFLHIAAAIWVTGCRRVAEVDKASERGVLLLGNGPEPQSLDFHVTTGLAELNIQMALYEGLVSHHPRTLSPVPAVAQSWQLSEAGSVYTFTLRDNAYWSDGQPVIADDFVVAWRRALSPTQAAPYANALWVIAGAREFNEGLTADPQQIAVRALDSQTLQIRLERPIAHFLYLLQHPVWYPIPAHRMAQHSAGRFGSWTLTGSFVGNGPFILEEWRPHQFIHVVKNPFYWDTSSVQLNALRFFAMEEPAAQERAFLAGQLHVTDSLPANRVAAYAGRPDSPLRADPYLGTYYLLLNTRIQPLDDVRVRKALALAIDRDALTQRLLGGGQRSAWGFVPDNMPGFASAVEPTYDPQAARQLLAAAGYPGGRGFPVLEYLFNTSESHRQIAEAIQAMWREQLGIEVRLANMEWRTYLQRRAQHDFQIARAVWIGDYPEPSTFLDLWRSGSVQNWIGWHHPEYDKQLSKAAESADPVQRMQHYRVAEQLLIADQPLVPLYFYVTIYLRREEVLNWPENLLHWPVYKHLRLQPVQTE